MATNEEIIAQLQAENKALKAKIHLFDFERMVPTLEDVCYHLGYNEDIIAEYWEDVWVNEGKKGLITELRKCSKKHHEDDPCLKHEEDEDCDEVCKKARLHCEKCLLLIRTIGFY